jgi:hypothetical protein
LDEEFAEEFAQGQLPVNFQSTRGDGTVGFSVCLISVVVENLDSDITVDTSNDDEAFRLLQRSMALADQFVGDLLDQLRISSGQEWLGLSGEKAQLVSSPVLVDDNNRRFPVNIVLPALTIRVDVSRIDATQFGEAMERAQNKEQPPVARSLLADAAYLVMDQQADQSRAALVLAAIACEVHAKDTLRRLARPRQDVLLELLLTQPRDWSFAAVQLFDKVMQAIVGTTLREVDHKLWKAVTALFEDRNRVVHRGGAIERTRVYEHVVTAKRAFGWLDSIEKGTSEL